MDSLKSPKRYRKLENYIVCDYHGEVHEARSNFYEFVPPEEEEQCAPHNWQALYLLGIDADVSGY